MRKAVVIAVLSFCALTAAAQDYYRYFEQERPLLSTEWGAGISGTYTGISSGDEQIGFSPRIGYGAYIGMSLCVGRHFALHAEIDYHFGNLLVTRGDISRKVKSRSIEMPILLTFRGVDRLRFSVGPVIAVMDRSRYDDDTETIEFWRRETDMERRRRCRRHARPPMSVGGALHACSATHVEPVRRT